MHCLRVFIVVLQELRVYYNVYHYDISVCIEMYTKFGLCVSELHAHLYPYHNVWPEAVYCCFTRTTVFSILFTC